MKTIIQQGNSNKLMLCKHCECIFLYSPHDVYKNRKHYYVDCPDCYCANIVEEKNKKIIIMEAENNGN